jgi:hypothetical protein
MAKKDKSYRIYGDLIHKHRPSIRSMIIELLYTKIMEKKMEKKIVYRPGSSFDALKEQQYKTRSIAVISNDGIVVEILKINELAADFLLNPENKFIEFNPEETLVKRGLVYNENMFKESIHEEN